ncbi:MAG: hypothetical protein ACJ72T_11735 [Nitrososphaeraceae archaeon]
MPDNIKFGLAIPQGWRRGDLPSDKKIILLANMNSQSLLPQQRII